MVKFFSSLNLSGAGTLQFNFETQLKFDISVLVSSNRFSHHVNKPVSFMPPYTPLLYNKNGVNRGVHYFLIFAYKYSCIFNIIRLGTRHKKTY